MPPPTNRLTFETSPYLLQHQHNPVDWFPWGHEAFTAAKTQNKPIFLSVGYSTCYWCHVMERQCFENPTIAAEMNRLFINIKVDREERPDVDQLYMTAVQVLTHQGGWPMSVFLTPDLRPFYGGTYFPPADTHGRPGFPTLLRALSDAFHNRKTDVEKSATQLLDILQQLAQPRLPGKNLQLDEPLLNTLITRSTADYDPANGGFGSAPKFPRQTLIELLLFRQHHHPDPQILSMLTHTLTALAHGGIHDHLGGAFHRYSTDAHWLVPHFEIMLYDNAMLAWCYAEAFSQTADPRFAAIARDICDFVLREMTDPSGAFYTAFDAEVDAREGLTYLWTDDQIRTTLSATFTSQQIDRFCDIYGLSAGPNFADPHHNSGAPDQNILFLDPDSPPDPNSPLLDPDLAAMRHTLYTARRQRKQPLLDTKIITSWNALMIRALAHTGQILEEPNYLQAAAKSANFLLAHHRTPEGSLRRTSRNGTVKHPAFLDDHAFLIDALLSLHTATNQPLWKQHAESLAEKMIENFSDPNANGFFFTPASATDLIVRQKVATDSPLPSGNAVAASALLSLGHTDVAEQILSAFAQQLTDNGEGMSAMLIALDQYLQTNPPLLVAPSTPIKNQPTSLSTQSKETVKITTTWKDLKTLHVKLTTAPGYHINANPAPKGLIATQLTVPAATVDYPPPEKNSPIYRSPTLTANFKNAPTAPTKISLTYQPCNDSACLPPVTQTLEITPMQ